MDLKDYIFNNQEYFEDFITRSTYHSNAIEGNTLSYAETYAILFNDNEFQVSAKPREIYEAINHKYAINYVMNHLGEELSEKMIKDTAILINRNISEISGYRTIAVRIRGAEHMPPPPAQVPQQMMYFVYNYNHTAFDSIYQKIAQMHLQFERIHPFEDAHVIIGTRLDKPSKIDGFALLSPNFFMPERGERNHHTSTYIAGQQYESLIAIKATIPSFDDGSEGPKSL